MNISKPSPESSMNDVKNPFERLIYARSNFKSIPTGLLELNRIRENTNTRIMDIKLVPSTAAMTCGKRTMESGLICHFQPSLVATMIKAINEF